MQKLVRATAVAVVLSVALVAGAAAVESGPARVYSDFASDGVLECGHSEGDLRAVLNDASIYQYGDPVTLNRLKLAIRRQLEGGCPGIAQEGSGGGLTNGWMVLVGAVLLLLTLGSGGWAARRAFQARR
jgi:hypothetical protein